MPLGKQAAAYTLASSFPDSCGKVQDAPPNPFSVFFPPALSIGFAFINTTPTFCKRSGSFVFPSHSGLGKMMVPPLCKNTPVHNGRADPRRGKNLPRFPDCPAITPGRFGKALGVWLFLCNPEYKTLLPPFFFGGSFCVSHSLRDWGKRWGRPSVKIRRCITEELSLAAGKISCALRVVPPSLQAVWESPWGLNFHEIRNVKHCSHLFSLRRGRE